MIPAVRARVRVVGSSEIYLVVHVDRGEHQAVLLSINGPVELQTVPFELILPLEEEAGERGGPAT